MVITAQKLADAIALSLADDLEPDASIPLNVSRGLDHATVQGELNLEAVAEILNEFQTAGL